MGGQGPGRDGSEVAVGAGMTLGTNVR